MTNERAKSELMQLYGSLSEEKKQALDVLMAQAEKTCDLEKSNFDVRQYKLDTDTAYECGYNAGLQAQADGEYISRKALLEDLYKRDYTKFTHRDFVALVQYQDIVAIPPEHDGCKDCKYETYPDYYYPCCSCKQNYEDEWQKKPQ